MKPSAVSDYDLGPYYKAPDVSFKSFPLYDSLMRGSHGGAAALAVEQRTAKTGERAITMLESKGIKVTLDTLMKEPIKEDNGNSFIRGIAVRCKSWMCQDCRRRKGFEVRRKLIEKANKFKEPRLLTLTVNREWFKSPEEAYHFIMDNKYIARLLTKELRIRRWVWVLEAQEATGDGWPHWHILIDISDLKPAWYNKETKRSAVRKPKDTNGWCFVPHFLDLNRVHRLLREWRIGEQCFLSERKADFKDSSHAIFYITKYLIKPPKKGFPKWMLDTPRLRFYQPSHDVGSIANESAKVKKEKRIKKHIAPARKPSELIAECRKKTVLSILYGEGGTGKSVFLHCLEHMVGKGNVALLSLSDLRGRFVGEELACRLINVMHDCTGDGAEIGQAEGIIKKVTSGEGIRIEKKGVQEIINRKAIARIVMATNRLPAITDTSEGFWDRMRIILFSERIRGTEEDNPNLKKEIVDAELPGLLNFALTGLRSLLGTGYTSGVAVFPSLPAGLDILNEHRDGCDIGRTFLREHLEVDPNGVVPKSQVVARFNEQCSKGRQMPSRLTLATALKKYFPNVTQTHRVIDGRDQRVWIGMRWKAGMENDIN